MRFYNTLLLAIYYSVLSMSGVSNERAHLFHLVSGDGHIATDCTSEYTSIPVDMSS